MTALSSFHRRMTAISALLAVLTSPLSPASRAGGGALIDVKLGFNYMTSTQEAQLWKDVDIYASFEAFLTVCNKSSNIERRMRTAAGACVEPAALQKVEDTFKAKKSRHMKESHKLQCDTDFGKKYTALIYAAVDEAVGNVSRACKSCFFC
jgi:hypothetical protein